MEEFKAQLKDALKDAIDRIVTIPTTSSSVPTLKSSSSSTTASRTGGGGAGGPGGGPVPGSSLLRAQANFRYTILSFQGMNLMLFSCYFEPCVLPLPPIDENTIVARKFSPTYALGLLSW